VSKITTDLSFLILTRWDETLGPQIDLIYPNEDLIKKEIEDFEAIGFATQIFMVSSSIFGSESYQKEIVDLPILSFQNIKNLRVRVYFNFRNVSEDEVRGGQLAYLLIVSYPNKKANRSGLTRLDSELEFFLDDYCQNQVLNQNLESIWNKVRFAYLMGPNPWQTVDDFFAVLEQFSEAPVFGMVNSKIIRSVIPSHDVDFGKYMPQLPLQNYKPGYLGQIFIEELNEYFYCSWNGAFSFLFRQPLLTSLDEIYWFMSEGLPLVLEQLWNLTLIDPVSETINLLTRIELRPELAENLLLLVKSESIKKLAGQPISKKNTELGISNPDTIYYLREIAYECISINKRKISKKLSEVLKTIGAKHTSAILTTIGYFYGELLIRNLNKKHLTLPRFIRKIYSGLTSVRWKTLDSTSVMIKNCPYYLLSIKSNAHPFLRGILSVKFTNENFDIENKAPNQFVLTIKHFFI